MASIFSGRVGRVTDSQSESNETSLLSLLRQQFGISSRATKGRRRRIDKAATVHSTEALEPRVLLAADFDLSNFPLVDEFVVDASTSGGTTKLHLRDRSALAASLADITIDSSKTEVLIHGGVENDKLWIDLSSVTTIDGSGTVTSRLGAAVTFDGKAGTDSVTFSEDSAVAGNLSIQAETITTAANKLVNASGNIILTATDAAAQMNSGISPDISGTRQAGISIGGPLQATDITLTAKTTGTVNTSSTEALLPAHNTFTDTATITVSPGAHITASGKLTALAERSTHYSATGRDAKNEISGNTTIQIGGAATATNITARTLDLQAVNNVQTTATSPSRSLTLGLLNYPTSIGAASARNLIAGDTTVNITNTALTQTGTTAAKIAASRTAIARAIANTFVITDNAIPDGKSTALGGTYASNHLSGNVHTTFNGGSLTASAASISAHDDARAHVKAGLSAKTKNATTGALNQGLAFGPSIAFNTIAGTGQSTAYQAIDTLLGTSASPTTTSSTRATLDDTTVNVTAGDLDLAANSSARANATISNAAESKSSALFGSGGTAATGILASNFVKTATAAHVAFATSGTATVSGALNVTALDNAQIYSNTKLVSSSIISNDGGARILQDVANQTVDYDYKSSAGSTALVFGKRVLVEQGNNAGGTVNGVYEYLGIDATVDLKTQDYRNLDVWKPVLGTELVPQGNNVSDSDAIAFGGMVVRNDVNSSATAQILNTTVNAGSVSVRAEENATIRATADATVTSSGGSAFGSGTSLAVNGIIATNNVLSAADASIVTSTVTTTSGGASDAVDVIAKNSSDIDAINSSIVSSGDTAAGVTLAFNTIGYQPQNTLFNALDALLKTDIGAKQPAKTSAKIDRSSVTSAGDISVSANSTAKVDSHVANEATSAASALIDASGMAASFILASNMVASDVDALITSSSTSTNVSGSNVNILAVDNSAIESSTKLLAASSTTNDAGVSLVNALAGQLLNEYHYSSLSGTKTLAFGDKIRVASTHANDKGDRKSVYQFMGTSLTADLAAQDYSNADLWKKLDIVNVLPPGLNVTDSDSMAIGGMVVRNDVLADVDASVTTTTIVADGNLNVTATGNQSIEALADATATSSGGSAFGTGTSLAINATIATNLILGGVRATVTGSDLTTKATSKGDISVKATNSALIDADNRSALSTGDTGVSVHLAFNTIGYESHNVLFQTIDTLVGTNIGTSKPVNATATVVNSPLTSDDNMDVIAHNDAQIESSLTNETVSSASALVDASGMAVGVVLASNMVQSSAAATINYTATTRGNVSAKGTITVESRNKSAINSDSQLDAQSSTSNDGGVSTATDWLAQFIDNQYDYTSLSGTQALGNLDYQHLATTTGQTAIGFNTRVLRPGTAQGERDTVYRFVGVTSGTVNVDLSTEDYSDTSRWRAVHRRSTTKVRVAQSHTGSGVKGGIYRFIGTPGNADLSLENYANQSRWERITLQTADFIPNIGNITDSDSIGAGVLIVRNDVRGDVTANINNAALSADQNIVVNALGQSDLRAFTENVTSSSGGSAFGEGTSLAGGATVATNLVLGATTASVTNSTVTAKGNVIVFAENKSGIDATINSAVTSGDTAAVVTLAYNTVGYEAQNMMLTGLQTFLGTNFGTKSPAKADAFIVDSAIDVDGNLTVKADNAAALNATISNAAVSEASALFGASGQSAGGLVASNFVASSATAKVDYTTSGTPVVDGSLTIHAFDNAKNYANTKLVSSSTTTNDGGIGVLTNTLNAYDLRPVNFISSDATQTVKFGDIVRLIAGSFSDGAAGGYYRYLGTSKSIDLSATDYTNKDEWYDVSAGQFIPQGLNIDDSDSVAMGGLLVMNTVESFADAKLRNATTTAGAVDIKATENATIKATVDSAVSSSGGSALGEGTSFAANGVVATNNVLSNATALVEGGSITTKTGGSSDAVSVIASNTATIEATNNAVTQTGDTAFGVVLAFNSVGYDILNTRFGAAETLLQVGLRPENPVTTSAKIKDADITSAGAVIVTANSVAQVDATISNDATSAASALMGASGMASSGIIASNMVSSQAIALIEATATETVTAGGAVKVSATDDNSIQADTTLRAISSTTNDAGASLLNTFANQLLNNYKFSSLSGTQSLEFGDMVRVASTHDDTKGTREAVYEYMGTPAATESDDAGLFRLRPVEETGSGECCAGRTERRRFRFAGVRRNGCAERCRGGC